MALRPATFLLYCILGYVLYLIIYVFCLSNDPTKLPVLLWWNNFVSYDETIICHSNNKCIVSGNKELLDQDDTKALLFYGSNLELSNLPKRNLKHYWSLFHEESPKNLPALRNSKVQQLFNITSTFSRYSTSPVTFQYLKSLNELTSDEYFIDVNVKNQLIKDNDQAAILYLQSDCDTPVKRDEYVKELMQYIKVDSYGACLNNKALPKELKLNGTYELFSEQLLRFSANYKFIISIENARCDDYITEKLWRPLIVGAIPIYLGSPRIKDWLPNSKSAIVINDFETMKSLAEYINLINNNDHLYNSYMNHILKQQVTNDQMRNAYKWGDYGQYGNYDDVIPAFQCFVCDAIHAKRNYVKNNYNIYDCEFPANAKWHFSWKHGEEIANKL